MYSQVIEEYKTAIQLYHDPSGSGFESAMVQGYGSGSWKGALTRALEFEQAKRKTQPLSGYGSAYNIAGFYAELGEKEEAFRWLNTAYQEHDMGLIFLRPDLSFDSIRSDPRFAEMIRKVGLPQ